MTTTPYDAVIELNERAGQKGSNRWIELTQLANAYRQGYQKRTEEDEAHYAKLVEACKRLYVHGYPVVAIELALADLEAK